MKKKFIMICFFLFSSSLSAEILVFKNCKSEDYEFEKNEYKIDINKGVMTREFVYTDETYQRLRVNDMRTQKENTSTKGVSKENGEIITEISGYPAFILR
jgi:hypothetical protein